MAADEGFEDFVAGEGDEAAIVGMRSVVAHVVRREAVVEIRGVVLDLC